jgi:hypothetical protein
MNNKHVFAISLIIVLSTAFFLVKNHLKYSSATKHETELWVAIQDVDCNRLSVETTSDEAWTQLIQLNTNARSLKRNISITHRQV